MSMRGKKIASGCVALVTGLLIVALVWVLPLMGKAPSADAQVSAPTPSPTVSATPTPDICPAEFVQVASGHENNNVDDQFAADYAKATSDAIAAGQKVSDAQRELLLNKTGHDAWLLAIWAHPFGLFDDPNEYTSLVEGDCLSHEGQALYNQFKGVLATAVLTEGQAPSNGTNSGVYDGTYGVNSGPGIRGDRKAIEVTLPDGTKVWIMVRCGNVVYPPGPPPGNLPKVPTDDPGPQGNAPVGGGVNHNPGPGTYIPPTEMERPTEAPRVNPPAPAPTQEPTAPGEAPKPTPTLDPAPAPSAEPSAPPTSDPVDTCVPAPGKSSC